ncbi:MAG: (deoxy)nucleoside triphosphate pyrophosphohydrolase [Lentimicrobium sp.]
MIDVTCAIIIKGNRILVTQRSEIMNLPLKWEFPGGKVEKYETEENCLRREIKEELNIEIGECLRLDSKIHEYENFTIKLVPFISEYLSGELLLSEHKAFKWLLPEELTTLDWAPADILVLNEFLNYYYERNRTL